MRAWPPDEAVHAAIGAASASPCAKSKRGVCVYRVLPITAERPGQAITLGHVVDLVSVGYNRQPGEVCDGACRPVCGRVCVHAEVAAIRNAVALASATLGVPILKLPDCEALHVKVIDGQLVPGGGPSCWQCSREVLDVGLAAFWLYEDHADGAVWVHYTAAEFHQATLAAMAKDDAITAARDADQLKVTVAARQAVADVVLQRDKARRERDELLAAVQALALKYKGKFGAYAWEVAGSLKAIADQAGGKTDT